MPIRQFRLRSRGESDPSTRVELAELAPPVVPYLGLVAYTQLEVFEAASRAVALAPDLSAKDALSALAGQALERHRVFEDLLVRRRQEPVRVMERFTAPVDAFIERIETEDWPELVLTVYLLSAFFDDFFAELARGVDEDPGRRAVELLGSGTAGEGVSRMLGAMVEHDRVLRDRLALWGRRLMGDSLLLARSALVPSENASRDAERIEPVFTELVARHMRRMDAIGLTA